MRILHAAWNPANQAGYVVQALRRMGHDAELWVYGRDPFGYPADRVIESAELDPTVPWRTFLEALERFDVLHFHFGRSLFPVGRGGYPAFWDLPVYRALGKKVFFTFHGSDCRIRRIHLQQNPWSYYRLSEVPADDERTEKTIEIVRAYADRLFVVSVDYLAFVPDALHLPRVIDLATWPELAPEQRPEPVIIHAPSRRETKGTSFVLDGLRQLQEEGLRFRTRLLEGVPHAEVKRAIGESDIVVDNLITGDYELVSIEAMASSRVAVANVQPNAAAASAGAPVVTADPDSFVAVMRELIGDLERRRDLAARGRDYVARVHDAPLAAAELVRYYGDRPRPVPARASDLLILGPRAPASWKDLLPLRLRLSLRSLRASLRQRRMRLWKRRAELR